MLLAVQPIINANPIDAVENIFHSKSLEFERRNTNEVVVEIEGKWRNMLLFFAWEEHLRCLHISCLMDISAELADRSKIFELLALVNENLWIGHFSYWNEHQMPLFKHAFIIHPEEQNIQYKLEQLIEIAVNECEHMYPVFKAVFSGNLSPQQALFPDRIIM